MKALLTLLILIVGTLTIQPKAQIAAVMEARAEIISGAAISTIKKAVVELPTVVSNDISIGSFFLTTASDTEVVTSIKKNSTVEGENSSFKSYSVKKMNLNSGIHEVSLSGELKVTQPEVYKRADNVSVIVEYL